MSKKSNRKIKKRPCRGTVGDIDYIENVPLDKFQHEVAWLEELRLTFLSIAQKAYDLGSRHIDVFKMGINALSDGTSNLKTALGEEALLTPSECLDLERFGGVPDRLWPLLADKVKQALANAPKDGPQPRHVTVDFPRRRRGNKQ